jgi:hypothetical protein
MNDPSLQPLVEDYRDGYPKFSALIGAEKTFHICRRFSNMRSRLLLLQQDKISLLEEQLEEIDQKEISPLFLGSSRSDMNLARRSVISDIRSALADYGTYIL